MFLSPCFPLFPNQDRGLAGTQSKLRRDHELCFLSGRVADSPGGAGKVPLEAFRQFRQGKGMLLPVGIDQDIEKSVCFSPVFHMVFGVEDSKGEGGSVFVQRPWLGGVEGELGIAGAVLFSVKM